MSCQPPSGERWDLNRWFLELVQDAPVLYAMLLALCGPPGKAEPQVSAAAAAQLPIRGGSLPLILSLQILVDRHQRASAFQRFVPPFFIPSVRTCGCSIFCVCAVSRKPIRGLSVV
jgi:hypothetical protein